jgi:hypothetical protein
VTMGPAPIRKNRSVKWPADDKGEGKKRGTKMLKAKSKHGKPSPPTDEGETGGAAGSKRGKKK